LDGERSPLLERLVARASAAAVTDDWRADALRMLLPADCLPPPPACAALRRSALSHGGWACMATPVHFSAGMSTVTLQDGGILWLDPGDAPALAEDFNRVFEGESARLVVAGSDVLVAVFDTALEVDTRDPEALLGRDVYFGQPSGTDGPRLRRLMSEIELWLFDHAVNRSRTARGLQPVTGLWLWGGGSTSVQVPPIAGWTAGRDPLFAAFGAEDVWPGGAGPGVIVSDAEPGSAQWKAVEHDWLEPAAKALGAGVVAQLVLSASDRSFSLGRGPHLKFWRRPKPWWRSFAPKNGGSHELR
jgi:hypothetical protein